VACVSQQPAQIAAKKKGSTDDLYCLEYGRKEIAVSDGKISTTSAGAAAYQKGG